MWSNSRCIAVGDVVILWMTREDIQPIVVTPGKELNGRYGVYRHSDLVGVSYGSKISSRNGKGFIHALRPTPELWTLALPHRTQILYHADISYISMWLGIKPGSAVAEAGTGSGSFSHSIARTVGPTGRLFSFEFHEQRANKARSVISRLKTGGNSLTSRVQRRVCEAWDERVRGINEVDSAVVPKINSHDLTSRSERPHWAHLLLQPLYGTGPTYRIRLERIGLHSAPMQTVEDAASRLRDIETRKEQRRLKQIEAAARDKKRKRVEGGEGEQSNDHSKRTKVAQLGGESLREQNRLYQGVRLGNSSSIQQERGPHTNTISPKASEERYIVSKPFGEVRGHTSYLTFAMLVPSTCDSTRSKELTGAQPMENELGLSCGPTNPDTIASTHSDPSETSATLDSLIAAIPEEVRLSHFCRLVVEHMIVLM
ncbi:GCD14 protein [Rhizoctonia solani AG-1 IA]|uniref:tRNA (adenine(58)-N(1))-methyltransferase catalytic subunit TRM61 n=1 Tax=Thanatephorus cucumeris (strain AG1-IA) TaxID=983506 RepID=L8X115_THACA|nr:GCD14 protein [Rhizoctonia solani AG-1 IA]